ncbi:MAG TPA: hypothetical protein VFA15_07625, partial [Nitrososphaera sp.]|nr:hypothetical protein [Nitrososphaera sp.]
MVNPTETAEGKKSKVTAKAPAAISAQAVLTSPVIIEIQRKNKRRKKKYSRGTKGIQRFLFGVSKATSRTANALADGADTFSKRSNKSSKRRRDGFIRDALRNSSHAFSDGATEFGKAPYEITKRIGT